MPEPEEPTAPVPPAFANAFGDDDYDADGNPNYDPFEAEQDDGGFGPSSYFTRAMLKDD